MRRSEQADRLVERLDGPAMLIDSRVPRKLPPPPIDPRDQAPYPEFSALKRDAPTPDSHLNGELEDPYIIAQSKKTFSDIATWAAAHIQDPAARVCHPSPVSNWLLIQIH